MAITKSGDIITVKFDVGDSKGNSYSNPYTFEDIYQADILNGWGVVTKSSNTYFLNCGIKIDGSSTYFWDYDKIIVFTKTITTYFYYLQLTNSPYFRSGRHEKIGSTWYIGTMVWTQTGASTNAFSFFSINGKIELYHSKFIKLRVKDFGSISSFTSVIYNCEVYFTDNFMYNQYADIQYLKFVSDYFFLNSTPIRIQYIDLYFGYLTCNPLSSSGAYAKNIRFFDNAGVKFYLQGGEDDRALILCDSNAPHDIVVQSNSYWASTRWWYKLNSTFNFNIKNGNGATITLKDKNGNIVVNHTFSGETYSQEVTYFAAKCWHIYDGQTANAYKELYDYQPFSLVISKSGYQDLIIDSITVTDGIPTEIRGELELNTLIIDSFSFTHPTTYANGTISLVAAGGVAPYQYSIDGGTSWHSSGDFTGLLAGSYDIMVKDNEGTIVEGGTIILKSSDFINVDNMTIEIGNEQVLVEVEQEDEIIVVIE